MSKALFTGVDLATQNEYDFLWDERIRPMSIQNVVFVRDFFWDHCWHLYLPTGRAGICARLDMVIPGYNTAYATYACLGAISFGHVRPGRFMRSSDTGRGASESGTWYLSNAYGWYFRKTNTDNDYAQFEVGPQYDRVQVLFYNITGNGGTAKFEIDDGGALSQAGLAVTSYNTGGDGSGVKTVVIDTGGHLAGKKLRITRTNATSGDLRLIGVQCFDTSGIADPAETDSGDNLFLGNDHIVLHDKHHYPTDYVDCEYISYRISAVEFALSWSETGGTHHYTGGSAHFNASDYPYTYASGTFTNGPNMFVDGTAVDDLFHSNHSRGEVITARQITLRSKGQPNGGWSTGAPDIVWEYDFSLSGIAWRIGVTFNAGSEVDLAYITMLPTPTENAYDLVRVLPDKRWLVPADAVNNGVQRIDALWQAARIRASLETAGPVDTITYVDNSTYHKILQGLDIPSLPGGGTPGAGDSWNLAGRLCFDSCSSEIWDDNLNSYTAAGTTGKALYDLLRKRN